VTSLDSFIRTESKRSSGPGVDDRWSTADDELPFDLETAIRVCRQAGYFEHASYLARKYSRHEDYLRIQIDDAGRYAEALAYIRRLSPEAVSLKKL
jgi:vacuolar protein sorting-associated protein 11